MASSCHFITDRDSQEMIIMPVSLKTLDEAIQIINFILSGRYYIWWNGKYASGTSKVHTELSMRKIMGNCLGCELNWTLFFMEQNFSLEVTDKHHG